MKKWNVTESSDTVNNIELSVGLHWAEPQLVCLLKCSGKQTELVIKSPIRVWQVFISIIFILKDLIYKKGGLLSLIWDADRPDLQSQSVSMRLKNQLFGKPKLAQVWARSSPPEQNELWPKLGPALVYSAHSHRSRSPRCCHSTRCLGQEMYLYPQRFRCSKVSITTEIKLHLYTCILPRPKLWSSTLNW